MWRYTRECESSHPSSSQRVSCKTLVYENILKIGIKPRLSWDLAILSKPELRVMREKAITRLQIKLENLETIILII
jgi:hypothetical protein